MQAFAAAASQAGVRVTPTGIVTKAIGQVLVDHPEMNRDVRGGRLRQREAIDTWVTMTDEAGRLAGKRITRLDERDLVDVQQEITQAGEAHKAGDARSGRWVHALVSLLPLFVLRGVARVAEFLMHTLRIPIPVMGISREGFGAVHVTNAGPFGIRHVATPIPPITGQAVLLAVGEIHEAPMVQDGEVLAGYELPITGTIDHRIVVGINAARWRTRLEKLLTDPAWMLKQLPEEAQEDVREHLPSGGRDG